MLVSHSLEPVFDDPNLIAFGGLPAVMKVAEQAGLYELVDTHVTVPGTPGANTSAKVSTIIAGMVVGADSISDLDVLRHGGMRRVFTGLRAPTTLGTHLRGYRFGHVRQLDAVASRLLARLAAVSPILAGADQWVYLDVDDTIRETHGYHKQGAAYGYSKVKGLNAQLAILSTPLAAPVIAMILQFAVSRQREFEADRVGAEILGRPQPLANALRRLDAMARHNRSTPPAESWPTVLGIVRQAYARAGLPHTRAHLLRHTMASRLLAGGSSLKEVADVLRHRSLNTTLIYAKLDSRRLVEVALPWPGSSTAGAPGRQS